MPDDLMPARSSIQTGDDMIKAFSTRRSYATLSVRLSV